MREPIKKLHEIFEAIEDVDENKNCHFDMEELPSMFKEVENELKAAEFFRKIFDVQCDGRFNSIKFIHGDTLIFYDCKNREEYEALRKVL